MCTCYETYCKIDTSYKSVYSKYQYYILLVCCDVEKTISKSLTTEL